MTGVRRVSRSILKYFVALYTVAVVVQIFLAGEGIFGGREEPIEDAAILDPHRGLGWFLTTPIALLLLIVALLAWLPNKRLRWISVALPFVLFLQLILAEAGRWGGRVPSSERDPGPGAARLPCSSALAARRRARNPHVDPARACASSVDCSLSSWSEESSPPLPGPAPPGTPAVFPNATA